MKTFPNQKQLVHVWTSETKQTNTAEEPHMKLSGYSTRGWDRGVSTETITTVYLGQKHNLESPNQDQLTFIWHYEAENPVKKDGTEILSAIQEKLPRVQGTAYADRNRQLRTYAFT